MKVLDLFCGAGGAAMGLHRAWPHAEIIGVDIKPQKHYPFTFIQADAMTFPLDGYDFIWASPPCQGYSIMRNLPWLRDKEYQLLIAPTRERLEAVGVPYCIENVAGAKWRPHARDGMQAGWLCGTMFGLPFYRHRLLETNFFWLQPAHKQHRFTIRNGRKLGARARDIVFSDAEDSRGKLSWPGRRGDAGHGLTPANGARRVGANVGLAPGLLHAREAMGVPWMSRDEVTQAVPPAYSEFIAKQVPR